MAAILRTARKWLLGREIAHMLATSPQGTVSQTHAAKILATSQQRMAALIGGTGAIGPGDLERLAGHLGFADPGYLEVLEELRASNHQRGFWSTGLRRAYAEDLRLLIDLENHADRIRISESEIVPALLQTEGYVRAQHTGEPPVIEGLTLDEAVAARLSRQVVLDRDDPPAVEVVMSESCLLRQWGDAAVMRAQRAHLAEISQRPNVFLRVVPFDAPPGRHSPMGQRFTLYRVPSPGAAGPLEVATAERPGVIDYLDDTKALTAHETAWSRLQSAALSFAESREFIHHIDG